jgi:hypothetical protein
VPRVPFDAATDYYQLLGLTPTATADEIQTAYRRLAKAYHPDLHADSAVAAARMARVNVAKSVLLDRDARASYDRQRALRRRVAPVGAAHTAYGGPRPAPGAAAPSGVGAGMGPRPGAGYEAPPRAVGRPTFVPSSGLDRTSGVLLLIILPLLGALVMYVVQAVQLVGQPPVRPSPADLALSPGGRPSPRNTADAVFLMVHTAPPSPRLGQQAYNLIRSRTDDSPDSELLRAVGRHLLQAGNANDAVAWQAAVAEVCALATRC